MIQLLIRSFIFPFNMKKILNGMLISWWYRQYFGSLVLPTSSEPLGSGRFKRLFSTSSLIAPIHVATIPATKDAYLPTFLLVRDLGDHWSDAFWCSWFRWNNLLGWGWLNDISRSLFRYHSHYGPLPGHATLLSVLFALVDVDFYVRGLCTKVIETFKSC